MPGPLGMLPVQDSPDDASWSDRGELSADRSAEPACEAGRSPAFDVAHPSVYIGGMKRQELEKALRQLGWKLLRHGGRHDVWTDGQRQEAIPRHAEIQDRLARAILQQARGDK